MVRGLGYWRLVWAKNWALREKRKGRRAGMLGFAMGFPFLFPISYFKHYSNLIEFKFKFEFNPSTQTNKTMLQHECTNILSL